MQPEVVVFPNTALPMSTLGVLAPLFKVVVLGPPSIEDSALATGTASGLVEVRRPERFSVGDSAEAHQRAVAMVRQWEKWLREHAGSGMLEMLKAGVQSPERETFRTIMRELRRGRGEDSTSGSTPTQLEADIFLHLVHIYDQQAAELEALLTKAEARRRTLEQILGEDEELSGPPPDYEERDLQSIPPVEYSFDLPQLAPRRLAAWGVLAMACGQLPRVFATTSVEAVELLQERLAPQQDQARSPAGASVVVGGGGGLVELGRVGLVDLGGLGQERIAQIKKELDGIIDRAGEVVEELGALGQEHSKAMEWFARFDQLLREYRAAIAEQLEGVATREAKVLWVGGMEPHALAKVMATGREKEGKGEGSCVVLLVTQGGGQ